MTIKETKTEEEKLKAQGWWKDKKGNWRDKKGQFRGKKSPNPAGRPKGSKSIRTKVREMSNDLDDYIQLLHKVVMKGRLGKSKNGNSAPKVTTKDRLKCAELLLAYGAGKPAQVMLEKEMGKKETLEEALEQIEKRKEELDKEDQPREDENPVAEWMEKVSNIIGDEDIG